MIEVKYAKYDDVKALALILTNSWKKGFENILSEDIKAKGYKHIYL